MSVEEKTKVAADDVYSGPFTGGQDEPLIRPEWASFMRTRMDACISGGDHDLCRREPNFKIEWPRRILKVTGSTATLMDFHDSMAAEYAALSYCWGSEDELKQNPPLKATTSTCSRLRAGIPVSDLPLTIRQALAVCSCLDMQYVWVDALCIIQDDNADWEAEARKMATVYSMAKVTIVAASSTSCHSGFLDINRDGEPIELPDDLNIDLPLQLVARRTNLSSFHFKLADFASFDPTRVESPPEPQDAIDHRLDIPGGIPLHQVHPLHQERYPVAVPRRCRLHMPPGSPKARTACSARGPVGSTTASTAQASPESPSSSTPIRVHNNPVISQDKP